MNSYEEERFINEFIVVEKLAYKHAANLSQEIEIVELMTSEFKRLILNGVPSHEIERRLNCWVVEVIERDQVVK